MIRRPPRSTLFPTRRSSDLAANPFRIRFYVLLGGGYPPSAPFTWTFPNSMRGSETLPNRQEHTLFEIGRSHFRDPGVVVGREPRFLLQRLNLALHRRHLVIRKPGDRLDLLLNGLGSARHLLFSSAGSRAGISIPALHPIDHPFGHFLALNQRYPAASLPGTHA